MRHTQELGAAGIQCDWEQSSDTVEVYLELKAGVSKRWQNRCLSAINDHHENALHCSGSNLDVEISKTRLYIGFKDSNPVLYGGEHELQYMYTIHALFWG